MELPWEKDLENVFYELTCVHTYHCFYSSISVWSKLNMISYHSSQTPIQEHIYTQISWLSVISLSDGFQKVWPSSTTHLLICFILVFCRGASELLTHVVIIKKCILSVPSRPNTTVLSLALQQNNSCSLPLHYLHLLRMPQTVPSYPPSPTPAASLLTQGQPFPGQ